MKPTYSRAVAEVVMVINYLNITGGTKLSLYMAFDMKCFAKGQKYNYSYKSGTYNEQPHNTITKTSKHFPIFSQHKKLTI